MAHDDEEERTRTMGKEGRWKVKGEVTTIGDRSCCQDQGHALNPRMGTGAEKPWAPEWLSFATSVNQPTTGGWTVGCFRLPWPCL